MTFDPSDRRQLEAFLRDQIAQGRERDKLDFKREWWSGPGGKIELIKDVNAMVNTFSLDFNDYGFLIVGVESNAGRITHDVPVLRTPGVDKLEASIAGWLGDYMVPQPRFFIQAFDEPGVGTWGALVILPNQSPPFIFSKKGTYPLPSENGKSRTEWTEGEWRLRRNAVTVRPGPTDYAHVIGAKIQAATEPLRQEVLGLQHRLAVLEGTVSVLSRSNQADLEVELVWEDEVRSEAVFVPAREAGIAAFGEHLAELKRLQKRASRRPSDLQAGKPQKMLRDGYGDWHELIQTVDSLLSSPIGFPDRYQAKIVIPFLNTWGLNIPEELRTFQAGFYLPERYSGQGDVLMGPEEKRAQAYLDLLSLAYRVMPDVQAAATRAPFAEFRLRIRNTSGVSTGLIRYTLQTSRPDALHRYAPGRPNEFAGGLTQNHERPKPSIEEDRGELLPGDTWLSKAFALKFGSEDEDLTVNVTVFAAGLPQPKHVQLPLRAIAIEAEPQGVATAEV